jgi:hypothetical protein
MKRVAIPDNQTALESPEKPAEQLAAPARYMGSHGQPNEPQGRSTASGTKEDSATKNVFVPGVFSGYSQRFVPRVSSGRSPCFEGNENNGINSVYRCEMDKLRDIKGLDQMPDAQIVGGKVYNGEKVAHLIAYGALAERLMTTDSSNEYFLIVVKLLPMDYIDEVETILDAEGYSVSRA